MPTLAPKVSSNAFKTAKPVKSAASSVQLSDEDEPVGSSSSLDTTEKPGTSTSSDAAAHLGSSSDDVGLAGAWSSSDSVPHSESSRQPNVSHRSNSSLSLAAVAPAAIAPSVKKTNKSTSNVDAAKIPTYRDGAEVNAKKPKASDFIDVVHALIIRAASEYECMICTKDAFPDTAKRNKWVKICWTNAGRLADENYTLIDPIKLLVCFCYRLIPLLIKFHL